MRELQVSRVFILSCLLVVGCGSTSPNPDAGQTAGTSATDGAGAGGSGQAGTGGGGGGSSAGGTSSTPTTCADLDCAAPATCDDASGDAVCACPVGYDDVQGDGSLCRDIDECTEGTDDCGELETCVNEPGTFTCMGVNECARAALNDCDANATCTDEKDGFSCACNAPWTGDGTSCDCPSGHTLQSGDCLADDGTACEGDDAECLNGHCVDGVCCAQACDSPAICETTDGATCADGSTCVYPVASDGAACEADSDPCTVDKCLLGACTDQTARDCADTGANSVCTDDTCDPADVTGDPCRHAANSAPCDDGMLCTVNVCANKVCDAAPLDCSDSSVCTTDSCDTTVTSGDPCKHVNIVCSDGNDCTDDSCHDVDGCQISPNFASCDDGNPCTDASQCDAAGECQGTVAHVCDDVNDCTDDDCNPLAVGDPCFTTPNTNPCDDGLSCTATDLCSGGGCNGSGNACGPDATGCTEDPPSDRICGCPVTHVDNGTGYCVPLDDQCLLDPCDANATCSDPTPMGQAMEGCDPLCTCIEGYSGTGCPSNCMQVDECAGDPCGIGDGYADACIDGIGTYTCDCATGFVSMDTDGDGNPTCVCDMSGTFALEIVSLVSWPFNTNNNVDAGVMVETRSWALVVQNHLSDGTLMVEHSACGGTTPDLCQSVDDVAYNTYFLDIWELASMPELPFQFDLPNPLPGSAGVGGYVTPSTCSLLGISLTDCDGDWPPSRSDVGGFSPTNGAQWVNHDGDSYSAMSSYAVTTGVSPVCPRPGGGGNYPYTAPGGVTRFHVASRAIASYEGDILSCDHIVGDVTGPDGGEMQQNSRLQGCNGPCAGFLGGLVTDAIDADVDPPPSVDDAVFEMVRIPNGSDCADVRAEF